MSVKENVVTLVYGYVKRDWDDHVDNFFADSDATTENLPSKMSKQTRCFQKAVILETDVDFCGTFVKLRSLPQFLGKRYYFGAQKITREGFVELPTEQQNVFLKYLEVYRHVNTFVRSVHSDVLLPIEDGAEVIS